MAKAPARTSRSKVSPKKTPPPAAAPRRTAPRASSLGAGTSPQAKTALALLGKRPPLTTEAREALDLLASDADRSELGGHTKAAAVRDEAVRVATHVDGQLAVFPRLASLYDGVRFAYFLEAILALDAQMARDAQAGGATTAARASAATARDGAIGARETLVRRLRRYAGRRASERAALAGVMGTTKTPADVQASLLALAQLADAWLARADISSGILASQAALTPNVVAAARAAAQGTVDAVTDATLQGRARGGDSPLVNRREGAVLLEIAHAVDVFEEAHEGDDAIERVRLLNPAVRHAIEGYRHTAPPPVDEEPPRNPDGPAPMPDPIGT